MRRAAIVALCLLVFGYALFEARKLLEGPIITILSPLPGSATSSSAVRIGGEAYNIAFLTINDKPAYTDQAGHFSLIFSPPPGYTVVTVAAVDRFGRRASKSVAFTTLDFCPLQA